MNVLFKLEQKKYKLQVTLRSILFMHLIVLALLIFMGIIAKTEGEDFFLTPESTLLNTDQIVKLTSILFGSIFMSKIIIGEYRKGTIQLLFTYPINRKKIILTKVCIVYLITLIACFLGEIIALTGLILANSIYPFLPGTLTLTFILEHWPVYLSSILLSGFIAIMPLAIGMIRKSQIHTLVASFILVSVISSATTPDGSLSTYLLQMGIIGFIAIISVVITLYMTVHSIEDKDLTD